ncbi:cytochrome d ubiquinol oxidase subunit II [Nocardiopsis trehalosi]|jgi:cytochrome bd-type quinol oxidase subunit 2|uniref:cytochrome d ubiquinol oxidase subunit II n=1 Tax=Nocardiopsis trehalosi TaxID=109329 RepID=UPI000836E892|nr:cytochrome d ubiquinol oxidase subunit II [Nocardiopsis trehalosi]
METVPALFLTGLMVGYFVLAGCDIGLGMLLPHLARTPAERRRLVAAAAPYFLGTEVWLVGAVGVVAGLFPALKAALVADLWPVLTALLAGWLLRDAGLWFRSRVAAPAWHRTWEAAITAGSWVLAGAWGLVVGGLLAGGSPASPFALACAVCVTALFALRGAAFGAERLVPPEAEPVTVPGPPAAGGGALLVAARAGTAVDSAEAADAAGRATRVLARAALAAGGVAAAAALITGAAPDRPVAALAAAAVLGAVLAATAGLSGPRLSRHTSALAIAVPPLVVAAAVALPVEPVPGGTLALVGYALAPVVPLMVLGQVWLYRMLRRPAPTAGFFA